MTPDRRHLGWGGMLAGTAVGDAWGYPVEFMDYPVIHDQYPDGVPFPEFPAEISDDTQMTIAVAHAVGEVSVSGVKNALVDGFTAWRDDPDNTRAPGITCMGSLHVLDGDRGREFLAGDVHSKGCGAIMRTAPCAWAEPHGVSGVAAYQTILTHAHPVAPVVSMLFTHLVRGLHRGVLVPADTADWVGAALDDPGRFLLTGDDAHTWLGEVPQRAGFRDADAYQRDGVEQVRDYWARVSPRIDAWDATGDPCEVAGGGWVAEEAFGVAVAVLSHVNDPVRGVQVAATSGGDSDSVAAVTGAAYGAFTGMAPFSEQFAVVESWYRSMIRRLSEQPPPMVR